MTLTDNFYSSSFNVSMEIPQTPTVIISTYLLMLAIGGFKLRQKT